MEMARNSGSLTQLTRQNFQDLVRRRAEIIFGKDNEAAVSQWVTYWTETLSRNSGLVNAFRSRITIDFQGKTVLDVGCGTGGLSQIVTEEGGFYIGCDFVFWVVELAQAFACNLVRAQNARLVQAYGTDLPLADGCVDIAVAFDIIEHLEGGNSWQTRFLKEVRRVLRPNGILLLTTPNRLNPFEGHTYLYGPQYLPVFLADWYIKRKNPSFFQEYKTYGQVHLLTPWKLKKLLHKAGLRVIHDFPWGMDLEDYPPEKRKRLKILNHLGLSWTPTSGFWLSACRAEDWEQMRVLRKKEWLRG